MLFASVDLLDIFDKPGNHYKGEIREMSLVANVSHNEHTKLSI